MVTKEEISPENSTTISINIAKREITGTGEYKLTIKYEEVVSVLPFSVIPGIPKSVKGPNMESTVSIQLEEDIFKNKVFRLYLVDRYNNVTNSNSISADITMASASKREEELFGKLFKLKNSS
jgi:hypothetical protein